MEDPAGKRGSEGEHLVLHYLGAFSRARGPEFWRFWWLPGGAEPCPHAQLPSSGGSVNDEQALKWSACVSFHRASSRSSAGDKGWDPPYCMHKAILL